MWTSLVLFRYETSRQILFRSVKRCVRCMRVRYVFFIVSFSDAIVFVLFWFIFCFFSTTIVVRATLLHFSTLTLHNDGALKVENAVIELGNIKKIDFSRTTHAAITTLESSSSTVLWWQSMAYPIDALHGFSQCIREQVCFLVTFFIWKTHSHIDWQHFWRHHRHDTNLTCAPMVCTNACDAHTHTNPHTSPTSTNTSSDVRNGGLKRRVWVELVWQQIAAVETHGLNGCTARLAGNKTKHRYSVRDSTAIQNATGGKFIATSTLIMRQNENCITH